MKKSFFFILVTLIMVGCATEKKQTPNKDRAEEMFLKVWELYRAPEYLLFSEYYPNSYRPDLTYFNDSIHQAQEVSYLWPMSGVFSSAVALAKLDPVKYTKYVDSMAIAVEKYYDTKRTPFGYQAYPVQFGKVDRYYDDNGLVGIDYIDAYAVTGNEHYLEKAKQVLTFILSGWSEDFDGGVSWLEGVRDQKPACSNGKAMVLALKLYEATGDPYYLETGKKFYDWIDKYLKDPVNGVVWNSWSTTAAAVSPDLYTYNTGTLLQAAVRLYNITGDEKYLDNAKFLADGSYKVFVKYNNDGIPYAENLPWFYLVLFRGYDDLYNVTGDSKYIDEVIKGLDFAWDNCRDNAGLYYNDWSGQTDESKQPKWLLDVACIPEFYARVAILKGEINTKNQNK